MNQIQALVTLAFGIIASFVWLKGFYESSRKNNPFGLTNWLFWLGIFVWGDAVVFGFFWFMTAVISFLLKDWLLFQLLISVFWVVRSLGETIYWLNQQFSTINRNPPERLRNFHLFKNDSIWFVYQLFWQTVTIVAVVVTVFVANLWLKTIN